MKGNRLFWGAIVGCLISMGVSGCSSKGTSDDSVAEGSFASMPVVAEKVVTSAGDTIIVADPSKGGEPVALKASELIDNLKLVRLDNADEALVKPGQAWITSERIIVYDGQAVKQFDHSGKYIGQIGAKGNGPGEYVIAPYDIYVNEKADRIFLTHFSAKSLLAYDLEGKFIGNIPLSAPLNKGFVGFDPSTQIMTLAALQFKGTTDKPYEVWTQDLQGNIKTSVEKPWLEVQPDYSNEIFSNVGVNPNDFEYSVFRMMEPKPDSLYRYHDGMMTPIFTANFGDKTPMHSYYSTPRFFEFVTYGEAEQVTDNSFIVRQNISFLVDRESLRGGYAYLDLDGVAPIVLKSEWLFGKTPDYFSYCIEPGTLADMLKAVVDDAESTDSKRDEARKLLDTISPDDNCYVIFGPWKK